MERETEKGEGGGRDNKEQKREWKIDTKTSELRV